jgi:hypothetical protein
MRSVDDAQNGTSSSNGSLDGGLSRDKLVRNGHQVGVGAVRELNGNVVVTCLACGSANSILSGEDVWVGAVVCRVHGCNRPQGVARSSQRDLVSLLSFDAYAGPSHPSLTGARASL